MIKSPLRYPGGKSRAIALDLPLLPERITEFREPFVGGGSVFLAAKQQLPASPRLFWINDLNRDLICFWQAARDQNAALVEIVSSLRSRFAAGRELYAFLLDEQNSATDFDRAVRFFIMNRITFSGVMDSGSYSQQAYEQWGLWNRRQSTKFNGVSYIVQRGAEAVYSPEGKAQTRALVDFYMENARIIREQLTSAGIQVYGGVNAPYVWVKTPHGLSSWDFFDKLLHTCNVVGTPGSGFGAAGEGYFRISAFNSRENVNEAMRRIVETFKG